MRNRVFSKVVVLVMVVAMLFLTVFTLSACIESCFGIMGGRQYQFHVWYRTDRTEFDIDDVAIEFFYGVNHATTTDFSHVDSVVLFFANRFDFGELDFENNYNIFFIREISGEDFFSGNFEVETRDTRPVSANHSEMITIPREVFSRDFGSIYFFMQVDYRLGFIQIHYKLNGNTVMLLSKEGSDSF